MLQLLWEAKTHMSNYTHTQTHTATIVFGVSPWKQPVQQRSHTVAHWFTASPCFQLAVGFGSALQDKVNSQQAADQHLSSLWLCPHKYSAKQTLLVGLDLSSIQKWLFVVVVTANKYYAHVHVTWCTCKKAFRNSLSSVRESSLSDGMQPRASVIQADVWNPACHHWGLCCACFPDIFGLHSCSVIVLLVHLWSKINTPRCVWAFEMSVFSLEHAHLEHSTL